MLQSRVIYIQLELLPIIFTGKTSPLATDSQAVLDSVSGMDIELKPIIKKLVMENSNDRYKDIFELRIDLENYLIVSYALSNKFPGINLHINKLISLWIGKPISL